MGSEGGINGWIVGGAEGTANAIRGNGGPDEINNFGVNAGDIIVSGITKKSSMRLAHAWTQALWMPTIRDAGAKQPGEPQRALSDR